MAVRQEKIIQMAAGYLDKESLQENVNFVMRSPMVKRLLVLCVFGLFAGAVSAKLPRNNPYQAFYNTPNHWTNEIKWSRVIDVQHIRGLVKQTGSVDSLVLRNTLDSLSKSGGGVLYFPKGVYFFNYDVRLSSGVVIRGADPVGITRAQDEGYKPPTRFEFPKYQPIFTGLGRLNSTAFKAIYAGSSSVNIGLVNIDINRACIEFLSSLTEAEVERANQHENVFPVNYHGNILVFGVRQNNAARPALHIPTKFMMDEKRGWQRWPAQYAANINIHVNRNCSISNCRLNDEITDNFEQPSYLLHSGREVEARFAQFKYDCHAGIWVNVWSNDLKLFENIEVMDNYIVTSSTWEKILAVGKNVVIANNVDNGTDFSDDQKIDLGGEWEVEIEWKKIAANDTLFRKDFFVEKGHSDTIPYRILHPRGMHGREKYPLVVFLHGVQEQGNDNMNQLKHLVYSFAKDEITTKYPAFVLAPQFAKDSKIYEPGRQHELSEVTVKLVERLVSKYRIDRNRIHVVGVSSGGLLAIKTVLENKDMFASATAISSLFPIAETEMKDLKNTSFSFYCGQDDENLPAPYLVFLVSKMRRAGVSTNLMVYKNLSHVVWGRVGEDPEFYKWLFSAHR